MLKPLVRKIKKFDIVGFDIETANGNKDFVLCSFFFDENDYKFCYSKEEAINFILNNADKFHKKLIFAHNLGFDFLGLFYNSESIKHFEIIQRGSDFILAQTYIYKGEFIKKIPQGSDEDYYTKIVFYDTFNFCKFSLLGMGKIINMPKFEKPEFLGQNPKNNQEWDILKAYNLNDSRLVKAFAEFLQNTFNSLNTQMKSTIASSSMDNFKRNFLTDSYTTPRIKDLPAFYESLKGGRTETFKRGFTDSKINVYDINSLYPSVMDKNEFPNPNHQHYRLKIVKSNILDYEGITRVKMSYNGDEMPYLPFRTPNKLIFPKGKIYGFYTNFEIRKAIENNYSLDKIYNGFFYTKNCKFFGDFVKNLYALRNKYKEEKSPMELPVKILMNSLYGKFAQDIFDKWELISDSDIPECDYLDMLQFQIGKSAFFRRKKVFTANNKPNFIIPIISSYVTAYAREELYSKMRDISDSVIMVDTDSIFTEKKLKTSNLLGDLKEEYVFKEFYPVKPKFYGGITTKEKTVCKIKGLMSLEQDIDIFREILRNPVKSYTKFMKFREAMLRNMIPNETVSIEKKFNLEDNKRNWLGKNYNIKEFQESEPLII